MDQKKIGSFLKMLRSEKGITQEQLAEHFHISGRTVSRWETGTNMPDISIITELADFYDVDVRELIEGERKNMNEEIKDVAEKMADYAGAEKGRLFKWVRVISLIGTALMTIIIIIQFFTYEPNIFRSILILLSFLALIAMAVTTLYANGILGKVIKKRGFVIATRIIVIALIVLSARFVIATALVVGIATYDYVKPYSQVKGTDNYDKKAIINEYGSDLDSGLYVFPDNVDNALSTEFSSSLKTGLFDTDGSIFLEATYSPEDYDKEIERLSNISYTVFDTYYEDSDYHIGKIIYDTDMYNYPAYIASDGFDHVYEYALADKENDRIVYVLLSYPDVTDVSLVTKLDYLKKDKTAYIIHESTLDRFSIYSFSFREGIWSDYTSDDEGRTPLGKER
ncbi:MAG: helix-turn-helix domain-containing protein [Lachnospiraceae bacterium]|nr:helix-turn-helix domain-containing protein [Lachnospiraceae bacterium]